MISARVLSYGLVVCGLLVGGSSAGVAQRGGGPFAGLSGSWSGAGSISLASGDTENIRCRASYNADGSGYAVQQSLRCASDSYNFNLSSDLRAEGGSIRGTWQESTRGVSGSVSGVASPGSIQVRADGPGFAATLSVATRGDRQSVSVRSEGTDLRAISISLHRSGSR
jgi:hypothetical protein